MRRRLGRTRLLAVVAMAAGVSNLAVAPPARSEPSPESTPAPVDEVDPLIGTFPPGFTVPGASTPFGMTQFSPDTEGEFAYSGYLWSDLLIKDFSLLHLSGPGVRKGGDIPLMPTVGSVVTSDPLINASPHTHLTETAEPGYYQTVLARYATNVEVTATPRTGVMRLTYPPAPQANVLFDVGRSLEGEREASFQVVGDDEVVGWSRGRYPVFFAARFDRPFVDRGTWVGGDLRPGELRANGNGAGGWVSFDTTGERTVTVKIGVSLVSVDGARRNRDTEVPAFDFESRRAEARSRWDRELSRVTVQGGTTAERRAFYTALYHSLLHPNIDSDVDGAYRGADGHVHHLPPGRESHYANFSSWDTYKAQNQLLATLVPDRYREMILSLNDFATQSGRLPRWGEWSTDAAHMSGDPTIPMIVDGMCRGVLEPDDPVEDIYAQMLALVDDHREPEMDALGYLPVDVSSRGAGTTLEYGVADFALSLVADQLGMDDDAQRLREGSMRYRHLMDPETGWIRPRNADGSWLSPFDPTDNPGFQEGNSWQYSWLAPHDAAGLFAGMGGTGVATDRLDHLFRYPLSATVPVVPGQLMSTLNVFGLVYRTDTYAPGNEHDLQVPAMYAFTGQPHKAAAVARQLQALFRATPEGLPGNDDLGGLSAWHVWSAMGLSPVTPGAPFYVIGSPMFDRVEISLPGRDRRFTIESPGASVLDKYVTAASLDGQPIDRAWIRHDAVAAGRVLSLTMASAPDRGWASGAESLPPSVSTHTLAAFGCRPG